MLVACMHACMHLLRKHAAVAPLPNPPNPAKQQMGALQRIGDACNQSPAHFATPFLNLSYSPAKQQMGAPQRIGDGCSFNSFRTSAYKLHFLESPSGLKVRVQGECLLCRQCARHGLCCCDCCVHNRIGCGLRSSRTLDLWHGPDCTAAAGFLCPAVCADHRPQRRQPSRGAAVHLRLAVCGAGGQEPALHARGALPVSATAALLQ